MKCAGVVVGPRKFLKREKRASGTLGLRRKEGELVTSFHGPEGPFFHRARCAAPSTALRVSACGLKLEDAFGCAPASTPPREERVAHPSLPKPGKPGALVSGAPGPAAQGSGSSGF